MDNILYEAQTTFQFDYLQFGVNVILLAFTGTIFVKCRDKKYKDTIYEVVKVISAFAFCFLLVVNGLSIINSIDKYKNIINNIIYLGLPKRIEFLDKPAGCDGKCEGKAEK